MKTALLGRDRLTASDGSSKAGFIIYLMMEAEPGSETLCFYSSNEMIGRIWYMELFVGCCNDALPTA
jgi:hypothetical protein